MGEVWTGRREAFGGAARDVAIKLLSAERASSAEARKMFLDEVRLSMLLRNSNIVQVHDVAETDDSSGVHVKGKRRYIPPEQLRGETREPTLDLFAVGAMFHELLDGVKFRSNGGRTRGMTSPEGKATTRLGKGCAVSMG